MAKKTRGEHQKAKPISSNLAYSALSLPTTTSSLKADLNLGYKLRVLLYDHHNMTSKGPSSKWRIKSTTDSLYIRQAVEAAVHTNFTRFLEKGGASGNARPCGSHALAPVFEAVFGISKTKLEDEKFIARLAKQKLRH
ncbi:UMTA methyltransferase [Seiridium cupressi]